MGLGIFREGYFFDAKLPMNLNVKVPCLRSGVRSVPRANESQRCCRLRAAPPIGFSVAIVFSFLFSSLAVVPKANAQSEDQIMAAFLFNFARYVEWPKDAFEDRRAPVTICILAADAFADVVSKTVSGKLVDNRPVGVQPISDLKSSGSCHILFIGRDAKQSHADAIAALDGQSVFAVSDRAGFASDGGIANFFRADSRIRFEINPSAALKVGLKISSRLLRLAKVVE